MTEARRVTLTFDNGPDPDVTPAVLDVLAARDVRATFFVVGNQLHQRGAMEVLHRAAVAGHWIGNHTLTHSVPLGQLTDGEAIIREIEVTQQLIGPLSHPDRLFRPFGSGGEIDHRLVNTAALDHLRGGRYTCVLWNCVPHDWDDPTGWVETCLEDVARRPWSTVVLHDLPTGAMDRLDDLLDGLEALGSDIVQAFPDDCVPLRCGEPTRSFPDLPLAPVHV